MAKARKADNHTAIFGLLYLIFVLSKGKTSGG
jgi:hypothetical protein